MELRSDWRHRLLGGRRFADQNGFALLATLAILAFSTLVILATMTYNLASIRIANRQTQDTAESRAALSGLESAIQYLRNAAPDAPASPGDPLDRNTLPGKYIDNGGSMDPTGPPCLGTGARIDGTKDALPTRYVIDGLNVQVSCAPLAVDGTDRERRVSLTAVVDGPAGTNARATTTVRIVDVYTDTTATPPIIEESFGRSVVTENKRICKAPADATLPVDPVVCP
jgi:hypothetical protein